MNFDYDLWPQVGLHTWKYRPRTEPIGLIQLHATRSGRTTIASRPWTMDDERRSSSNWFTSSDNKVPGAPHEAAMCTVLIGNGTLTRVMPEEMAPHHSLGHADASGLSVEICQPLDSVPFLPEDLRLAAQVCAEWSAKYDIPVRMIPFLSSDNHEGPGYVRHDRSAQGRRVGKSDPGSQFPSDREFEEMVKGDDDMDIATLQGRMNYAAVLKVLEARALAGVKPPADEIEWARLVLAAMEKAS